MNEKEDILKNLVSELRKGVLVLAVLSQLKQKHYGYSLVERLNEKGLRIDQNTLYPLLRRLDKHGLINSTWEMVEPRPRKYYQLNAFGTDIAKELISIYKDTHSVIAKLLKDTKL
ncbi:MAG: PadR family transcriptional regulator [Acholeplasmataceae bacterium]